MCSAGGVSALPLLIRSRSGGRPAAAPSLGLMFLLGLGIGLMGMAMPLIWALQPSGVVPYLGWPVWNMLHGVAMVPPGAALVVISWWVCGRMSLGSARQPAGRPHRAVRRATLPPVTSVVVVEDLLLLRDGLIRLLRTNGFEVAAAVDTGGSATCSRTGSATSASSSRQCGGWPMAVPRWIPR